MPPPPLLSQDAISPPRPVSGSSSSGGPRPAQCGSILPRWCSRYWGVGTVRDATGLILPGVTVDARDAAGVGDVTFTDGTGQFTFSGLEPGTYEVTFALPGFDAPAEVVQVSAGVINFQLKDAREGGRGACVGSRTRWSALEASCRRSEDRLQDTEDFRASSYPHSTSAPSPSATPRLYPAGRGPARRRGRPERQPRVRQRQPDQPQHPA